MTKFQILFPILLICINSLIAQDYHKCGLHLLSERLSEQNPDYDNEIEEFARQISNASESSNRTADILTVPVVVHVIHSGQTEGSGQNISDSRIRSQIEALNRDYRKKNSDINQIPGEFSSLVADTEIEFKLVDRNPQGQFTNGIVRHQYNTISNIDYIENVIKPFTKWNPYKYLNIWVLKIPQQGVIGYSYLPTASMIGSNTDGVVIDYEKFGQISGTNNGRTCTHEVGHYLGLMHPWGNDSGNPNCTADDNINDTPKTDGPYFGCPSHPKFSCSSSDMFMNYMDYVDDHCMHMFTNGQKNVMRSILQNQRNALLDNGTITANEEAFLDKNTINCYPNPAINDLSIDVEYTNTPKHTNIKLLNTVGQVLNVWNFNNQKSISTFLDVSNYSNGIYFLQVESDGVLQTEKVIISH